MDIAFTAIKKYRYQITMFLIGSIFIITRLYLLGVVPSGIHVDEAGMAYDAYNLLNYGTDRYGNPFPVYLINFDAGQSALYAYLASLCIRLFGLSLVSVRIPAVFSGALLLIFGYLIGANIKDKKTGCVIAFLITVCPYFIMSSRWGLDCNLFLGFFTMSLYFFMKAVECKRLKYYVLAGISYGITLYSYSISWITLPVFLLIGVIYLCYNRLADWKKLMVMGIPLLLLALPLMAVLLVNNGVIHEIKTDCFTVPKLFYYRGGEFSLSNIRSNLKLFRTLLTHDHLNYNADASFGTLYYISIPFLALGFVLYCIRFIKSIKRRVYDPGILVLLMGISVLFCSLVVFDGYIINKANAIYFSFAVFIAEALMYVWKKCKAAAGGLGVVYLVLFLIFCNSYFNVNRNEKMLFFDKGLTESVRLVEVEMKEFEGKVYVDPGDIQQPYIYMCLAAKLSPEEFMTSRADSATHYGRYYFDMPDNIDREAVYIVYNGSQYSAVLDKSGFECIMIEDYFVYY